MDVRPHTQSAGMSLERLAFGSNMKCRTHLPDVENGD